MELPNYLDFGGMYEMNPMAFNDARNQMGLAQQFQGERLEQERQRVREIELSNLFNEQNNPLKIQEQQISNRRSGYEADEAGVNARIATATEPFKLDAEQRKLVMEASRAELDGLEIAAQQMSYSTDPNERRQGEQLMLMHKDFVRMREEARLQRENQDRQNQQQMSLENLRHRNATERTQASGGPGGPDDKMSTDQRISFHQAQAFAALQAGNQELANMHYQQAEYLAQLRMFQRPDPRAGDPDFSAQGLPTVPERSLPPRPGTSVQLPPDTRGPISRTLPQPVPNLPEGARQIGTSNGRPVYEINGRRFTISE